MKKKIFIHVGYPKTATTTLQKHFYPKIEEINYLGIFDNQRENHVLGEKFFNKLFFSDDKSMELVSIKEIVGNIINDAGIWLISQEEFLALTLKRTKINKKLVSPRSLDFAKRIRQVFCEEKYDVKIIVSIRKQDQMITSLYAQSYVHYHSLDEEVNTFNKFLNVFTNDKPHPFKEALNYDKVLSDYESVFGKDNVNIILFEELAKDSKEFYSKLCDVLDIPRDKYSKIALNKKENVRSTKQNYKQAKKLSLFDVLSRFKAKYLSVVSFSFIPRGFFNWMKNVTISSNHGVSKTIHLDANQVALVKSVYEQSNKQLAERYGLNLKKHGYFD